MTSLKLPKKLLLTGGKQRALDYNIQEWSGYERAIALEVDLSPDLPAVRTVIDYQTPPDLLPEQNASITFKAGHMSDEGVWISTQTEALFFSLPDFKLQKRITHPAFNDVHHIMSTSRNTLVVTSTGLDAVFEYDQEGDQIAEWSTLGNDIWQKFNRSQDYRKITTTKPHQSHPNFCTEINGQYWVTRFNQKDTYCLQTGKSIALEIGAPHDGNIVDRMGYFTHVNGHLSEVDFEIEKVIRHVDMNPYNNTRKRLGWCRGVHRINNDRFLVGFSRIRPSKYQQSLEWLKNKIKEDAWPGCLPTRICLVNTSENCFEWELDLEPYGMNAIFSILPYRSD